MRNNLLKKNTESIIDELENEFYECKPHTFAALAVICCYFRNYSSLLTISGILFGCASITIFYLRYFTRNYR